MDKKQRHEIAENFRRQIVMPSQRAEAIRSILAKPSFDESDKVRIGVLLHKVSNAMGCDKEYNQLIARLYQDDALRPKAEEFYKRWNA